MGLAVLWIDDTPDASLFHSLAAEGFHVDHAGTGSEGMALARTQTFDVIVVDMHLPDIHGVSVIERLRGACIKSPVLAVTGYYLGAEAETHAHAAGATAFRYKPLWADEIADDLKTVAGCRDPRAATNRSSSTSAVALSAVRPDAAEMADPVVAHALARLERTACAAASAGAETRDRLMVELLAALADPTLTLAGFHACAAAALQTWHAVPDADVQELARDAMRIMHQAARHPRPSPPRHPSVRMAFEVLLREPRWLKEEKVADAAAVSPSHLGRLLVAEVGLDYRALRRGVVMKAAVIEILAGDEQVAQIAYRLGMHPGTFDQIFHETFGSSPRELRRYWRRPRS